MFLVTHFPPGGIDGDAVMASCPSFSRIAVFGKVVKGKPAEAGRFAPPDNSPEDGREGRHEGQDTMSNATQNSKFIAVEKAIEAAGISISLMMRVSLT